MWLQDRCIPALVCLQAAGFVQIGIWLSHIIHAIVFDIFSDVHASQQDEETLTRDLLCA